MWNKLDDATICATALVMGSLPGGPAAKPEDAIAAVAFAANMTGPERYLTFWLLTDFSQSHLPGSS
jgi:hypothetical protein